jgi:zinc protease
VHDRRVPVPQLTRLYLAPQRRAGDQMQAAALVVLADLLGGERVTSIMARDLVGEDGIALAAAASYSGTGLNRQPFALYLVPRPGVDRAAAELALDALLAELIEQGPDPEEIERINGRVRGSNIYLLDDVSKRASRIGEALATGLTIEDVEAWPVLLESVTADDVRAVAIDLFRRENAVAGWLLPSDLPSPELPQ